MQSGCGDLGLIAEFSAARRAAQALQAPHPPSRATVAGMSNQAAVKLFTRNQRGVLPDYRNCV